MTSHFAISSTDSNKSHKIYYGTIVSGTGLGIAVAFFADGKLRGTLYPVLGEFETFERRL